MAVLPPDAGYEKLTREQEKLWETYVAPERSGVPEGVTRVGQILSWREQCLYESKKMGAATAAMTPSPATTSPATGVLESPFEPDDELNEKVALWQGSIVNLEADAIVNAANTGLVGGGGVDGAIHRAAGPGLLAECRMLVRPGTPGRTKITKGYALAAAHVLHTVGPVGEHPATLLSCYDSCLRLARAHGLRTLAFCGVSTGVYGYPVEQAAKAVLSFVRRWLQNPDNAASVSRIVFVNFVSHQHSVYQRWIPYYFPPVTPGSSDSSDPSPLSPLSPCSLLAALPSPPTSTPPLPQDEVSD